MSDFEFEMTALDLLREEEGEREERGEDGEGGRVRPGGGRVVFVDLLIN